MIALVLALPVIVLFAAFVLYLNIGNIFAERGTHVQNRRSEIDRP
jgi:hypothetical protein